jgi:hypothetical protein
MPSETIIIIQPAVVIARLPRLATRMKREMGERGRSHDRA